MRIILSPEELQQCSEAAAKRTQYARSTGIKNQRKANNKSDLSVDYIGMVGEMAVGKVLGLEMDLDKVGVDKGIDFIYKGLTIDVKTRSYPGDELMFKKTQYFRAQVAILARFKRDDCVDIIGCINRKRFIENAYKKTYPKYSLMTVDKELLKPIQTLLDYEERQP